MSPIDLRESTDELFRRQALGDAWFKGAVEMRRAILAAVHRVTDQPIDRVLDAIVEAPWPRSPYDRDDTTKLED